MAAPGVFKASGFVTRHPSRSHYRPKRGTWAKMEIKKVQLTRFDPHISSQICIHISWAVVVWRSEDFFIQKMGRKKVAVNELGLTPKNPIIVAL